MKESADFLTQYGWMGISIILAGAIVLMVLWWIKKERPRLATMFQSNEAELKSLLANYETILGNVGSKMKDVYDNIGGMEAAVQKAIDIWLKSPGEVDVKDEIRRFREEGDSTSHTEILEELEKPKP